ncbi:hypothetical protein Tco_0890887 [Tanacetum coccineum]|uniref:Uncharacterized protein n=1 Tax=Tanacetum coccineum TaxID=301880 RepID=A0ABQ5C1B3_9ASTR
MMSTHWCLSDACKDEARRSRLQLRMKGSVGFKRRFLWMSRREMMGWLSTAVAGNTRCVRSCDRTVLGHIHVWDGCSGRVEQEHERIDTNGHTILFLVQVKDTHARDVSTQRTHVHRALSGLDTIVNHKMTRVEVVGAQKVTDSQQDGTNWRLRRLITFNRIVTVRSRLFILSLDKCTCSMCTGQGDHRLGQWRMVDGIVFRVIFGECEGNGDSVRRSMRGLIYRIGTHRHCEGRPGTHKDRRVRVMWRVTESHRMLEEGHETYWTSSGEMVEVLGGSMYTALTRYTQISELQNEWADHST